MFLSHAFIIEVTLPACSFKSELVTTLPLSRPKDVFVDLRARILKLESHFESYS